SSLVSTAELRVDSSLYTPGATLQNVVLSVGGGAATAVQWVNEVGVSVGSIASGLTMNLTDVNGDGRADVVLTAADGRVWTRLSSSIVTGTAGNDTLSTGAGDDTVDAGAGDDIVDGGPGNDVLYGGDGNDTLTGGPGDDQLLGGAGTDT